MDKCLYKEVERRGLHRTFSVLVRGGKRTINTEQATSLNNFLTKTLPSGVDRKWLLQPLLTAAQTRALTLPRVCRPAGRGRHSERLWGHDGDQNR